MAEVGYTHILEEDEESFKLPDTWPNDDAMKPDIVRLVNVKDEKTLQSYLTYLKSSNNYPMKHLKRGNVIVINIENMINGEKRAGTEHDTNKIRLIFSQLGFNVIIYNDLTRYAMERTLLRESEHDYSNHDCFILFILSHGDKKVVVGTDSEKIAIKKITSLFSKNTSLVGKPKLFFIQACQGKKADKGQTVKDEPSSYSNLQFGGSPIQSEQNDLTYSEAVPASHVMGEDEEETDGTTLPSNSDVFLSIATVEGFVSWRHPKYGSFYIQAICYVFRMYAYKHDLNAMMTVVNDLVSKAETGKGDKQMSCIKDNTLRKQLKLFPGFHEPYVEILHKYREEQIEKQNLKKQLVNLSQQCESEQKNLKDAKDELQKKTKALAMLTEQLDQEKSLRVSLENELVFRHSTARVRQQNNEKHLVNDLNIHSKKLSTTMIGTANDKSVNLLMIGKTGNGKSALGNSILRKRVFVSSNQMYPVTSKVDYEYGNFQERILKIVDVPGVLQFHLSPKESSDFVIKSLEYAISFNPEGYHAFLLVLKYGTRFTKEDNEVITFLKKVFGEDFVKKFCVIVVTGGDYFERDWTHTELNFHTLCEEQTGKLKELLKECSQRIVLFDNFTENEDKKTKQIVELLKIVDNLASSGKRYTDANFEAAKTTRDKLKIDAKETWG